MGIERNKQQTFKTKAMKNSTFTPGQSVTHKKFGVGTVSSFDGKIVVVDFNGTEKSLITAFAGLKAGKTVTTHADKYKARKQREAAKSAVKTDPLQDAKTILLALNKTSESYKELFFNAANKIGPVAMREGNEMVDSILTNAMKYGRISEKQAYCVAKFAVEQGINI